MWLETMATRITKALRKFFEDHEIPLDKVLDVKGMSRAAYKRKMKSEDYWVAIGTEPCSEGHQVKTGSGRCPICSPSSFGFSRRYREPGRIYLAYSHTGGLAKFGYSKNVLDRVRQLNGQGCGLQKDWKVVNSFPADNAAVIEEKINRELERYRVTLEYLHKPGKSRELFRYPYPEAVRTYAVYQNRYSNEEIDEPI